MYKITSLFKVLESGFKKIIGSSKTTCQDRNANMIKAKKIKVGMFGMLSNVKECLDLCASDDKCNYLYFNTAGWCITFKNCAEDEREERKNVGTTYMKAGNITR